MIFSLDLQVEAAVMIFFLPLVSAALHLPTLRALLSRLIKVVGRDVWIGIWPLVLSII